MNAPLKPLMFAGNLLEKFATHVSHREPLLTSYSVGLLGITQTLDISRAKSELGYKPIVSLREGLALYADWQKNAR